MNLSLIHNPYKIETTFLINDKKCDNPWFRALTENNGVQKRLQMWIMDFFPSLKEENPTKTIFNLYFSGTATDCDDIIEEAKIAEEKLGITIKVQVNHCGNTDSKFSQLQKLYHEAKNGPYDGFKSIELNRAFGEVESRELSVSVMAPMKNGKSTLLNAIIGRELLPNQTQRCTAKISYIRNEPTATHFEAKYSKEAGNNADYIPCSLKLLQEWNCKDDVKHVYIRGKLPGIRTKNYKLQFIDTPGPDSATHKEDRATIERFLNDNSLPMVCYIIDIVNDAEVVYLKRIKEHMSKHGKQSEDRFIFVVTRMDQLEITKDDTHDSNPIKTKIDDIRRELNNIGISNPRVYPVSSLIALKARNFSSITDEDEKDDLADDFKSFNKRMKRINGTLNDYMHLSTSVRNSLVAEINEITKKIDNNDDEPCDRCRYMEILSGIPALEKTIEEYLLKYSVPARISDAAKAFEEGISQAHAEQVILGEIQTKQASLQQITNTITQLRFFLKNGEEAKKIRTNLATQEWKESAAFKKTLDTTDREFILRIREKIAEWEPNTDAQGTVSPEEAIEMITEFKSFMAGLSNELLGVYANAVEDDTNSKYSEIKQIYDERIRVVIGEMPESLRNFVNQLDFVKRTISQISIKTQDIITESTEEYIEIQQREITFKQDGFWRGLFSSLPFTEDKCPHEVKKTRTIRRVKSSDVKKTSRDQASIILQEAIGNAEELAKANYQKLKEAILKEFDKVDQALAKFSKDLEKHLSSQEMTDSELKKYQDKLDWVKSFQEKLNHVLDMQI